MKKKKISLQLGKQKISSLSGHQVQGGNFRTNTTIVPIRTIQNICVSININCKSVIIACEPIYTLPSGCTSCPTTDPPTITFETLVTC
jgi:hypothetical protein